MNVTEKNEGIKMPYVVNNTTICFDETITVNLTKMQKDVENVIDICLNNDSQLTTGLGKWYIANIILPPKEYEYKDTGVKDDDDNIVYERAAKPLDMEKVDLILWTIPNGYLLTGGEN